MSVGLLLLVHARVVAFFEFVDSFIVLTSFDFYFFEAEIGFGEVFVHGVDFLLFLDVGVFLVHERAFAVMLQG